MTPVFYTHIRPAHGQTEIDVIRRAHVLGYELVRFAGWTDSDIGPSGMPGPRRNDARENLRRANEIQDACMVTTPDGTDFPHIIASA